MQNQIETIADIQTICRPDVAVVYVNGGIRTSEYDIRRIRTGEVNKMAKKTKAEKKFPFSPDNAADILVIHLNEKTSCHFLKKRTNANKTWSFHHQSL